MRPFRHKTLGLMKVSQSLHWKNFKSKLLKGLRPSKISNRKSFNLPYSCNGLSPFSRIQKHCSHSCTCTISRVDPYQCHRITQHCHISRGRISMKRGLRIFRSLVKSKTRKFGRNLGVRCLTTSKIS